MLAEPWLAAKHAAVTRDPRFRSGAVGTGGNRSRRLPASAARHGRGRGHRRQAQAARSRARSAQPARRGAGPQCRPGPRPVRRHGNIVAGLAERWNVSDDGLSYIFRLAATDWPNGRKVTAQQVARILKRSIASSSNNPLKDTLGAVEDIVAMTDRVVEVRLHCAAAQPPCLARPARTRNPPQRHGHGSVQARARVRPGRSTAARARGPSPRRRSQPARGSLPRRLGSGGGNPTFAAAKADLVLGGTFADLPSPNASSCRATAFASIRPWDCSGWSRFAPAGRSTSPTSGGCCRSIDRDALIDALNVPGLAARATVLEPALEGVPDPQPVAWAATPLAQRRPALIAEAQRLFGKTERPTLRILLPQGPGRRPAAQSPRRRLGGARVQGRARRQPRLSRPRADRCGRPLDFAGLVPAPVPVRICAGLRSRGGHFARRRAQRACPGATRRLARPGGGPDRRRPIVHSDHGASALVAGVEPRPGLRREPLRASHADRTAVEAAGGRDGDSARRAPPLPGIGRDPASVRQRVEAMEKCSSGCS